MDGTNNVRHVYPNTHPCTVRTISRSTLGIFFQTTHVAEGIIQSIVGNAKALGVDGVDLVQREGCGVRNLRCNDQTSVHLHIIEGCIFNTIHLVH